MLLFRQHVRQELVEGLVAAIVPKMRTTLATTPVRFSLRQSSSSSIVDRRSECASCLASQRVDDFRERIDERSAAPCVVLP